MRDPQRIKPLIVKIFAIWEKNPDFRLMQLLGNCFPAGDHYYREDEDLDKALTETYMRKPH